MPIYVYVCTVCAYQFEKIQKMDSKTTPACPECGQESERGIEKPSQFVWGRGGGWS